LQTENHQFTAGTYNDMASQLTSMNGRRFTGNDSISVPRGTACTVSTALRGRNAVAVTCLQCAAK